jgi:hypothetical protein
MQINREVLRCDLGKHVRGKKLQPVVAQLQTPQPLKPSKRSPRDLSDLIAVQGKGLKAAAQASKRLVSDGRQAVVTQLNLFQTSAVLKQTSRHPCVIQ